MEQTSTAERMEQGQPLVTVVVATHNRPDALVEALSSLCRQTMGRWLAWVVGDCCDPRTGAVVTALADPRVRYVNLPQRCGDQSGPNSIGAALCRTPYLAFLNHDDLLLSDHLQRALAVLERTGSDFYLGWSYSVIGSSGGAKSAEPDVVRGAWGRRRLWQAYLDPNRFEPASAWVMRADAYRRVGDWRDGFHLFRVPIGDWLLRAARARLRTADGEVATVVKVAIGDRLMPAAGTFLYDLPATVLQIVGRALAARDADTGRAWLDEHLRSDFGVRIRAKRNWIRWGARKALTPAVFLAALVFRFSGLDALIWWWRLTGRKPGDWKRYALQIRTKEGVAVPVDMTALKRFAQSVAQLHDIL